MEKHINPQDDPNQDMEEIETGESEEEFETPMPMASGPDFYQQRMHIENSRRLTRLESSHGKMLTILARIEANTADLPRIKDDVDELKEGSAKVKGAMWLVLTGSPLLSWLAAKYGKF